MCIRDRPSYALRAGARDSLEEVEEARCWLAPESGPPTVHLQASLVGTCTDGRIASLQPAELVSSTHSMDAVSTDALVAPLLCNMSDAFLTRTVLSCMDGLTIEPSGDNVLVAELRSDGRVDGSVSSSESWTGPPAVPFVGVFECADLQGTELTNCTIEFAMQELTELQFEIKSSNKFVCTGTCTLQPDDPVQGPDDQQYMRCAFQFSEDVDGMEILDDSRTSYVLLRWERDETAISLRATPFCPDPAAGHTFRAVSYTHLTLPTKRIV
eukprot:TRINITY_DN51431_c0_g1_i1.p1 TRINITY_DN51431_c0_g1~~TRINITY_DN51431_c0_g1_i1.p1  ORF type:complete len:269 (-),score=49.50 TRINITY_DN51431_c0_g1_i1:107-913(-)